ncbi:hypothetical protein [Desulforhopalus sp. IMCC35007]|uniref:hypothetical protein n=1 Tax=Desulforhopalus sp. IMCC35007 TaxID=2569543 RepID=UPI0010AE9B17|nr:hypothetical protein [Desulforhopalus sp. IMCC35007]TKB09293.1 hypothetical protein FCL48_10070 [Desulforhopalus sp. IMCC35007]
MQNNTSAATVRETHSRKTKISTNTNYNSKKTTKNQTKPRSERSRLIALQDALQDPIISCEGL